MNSFRSLPRCPWAGNDPLYVTYHDCEWGVAVKDDQLLFEFLILEGAQAGLSWITILRKRQHYRKAFAQFNPERVAQFNEREVRLLLQNQGIIRNRSKIKSAIQNARAFLNIQSQYKSFSRFIWQFVEGRQKQNKWRNVEEIPTQSVESKMMSKELVRKGFSFVGPVICYSFMQAVGMVNDHIIDCFRYKEITQQAQRET